MNKIIFKLNSYNITYLNKIKLSLIKVVSKTFLYKSINILLYLKWQLNNSLKTNQIREYHTKIFTLLRSPFVDKTSREQLSLVFFNTDLSVLSIFNNKYYLSNYNLINKLLFTHKQFYLYEKKKNCYLFKI